MKQQKSLALMFILGAFLTGGALGFVADRATSQRPYSREFDRNELRQEFASALNLSAEQRVAIDSIFEWRDGEAREIKKRYKPAMDSLLDSGRVLMNARLDSTQRRLFLEIRDSLNIRDSLRRAQDKG